MTKRKTDTKLTGSAPKVFRRRSFDLDATIALSMTDLDSDIEDELQFQNLDQERSDQEDLDDRVGSSGKSNDFQDESQADCSNRASEGQKDKSKLRMEEFNRNEFKAVIVDEAHHAVSETYMRVFEHFGVLDDSFKMLLWGYTATPTRADKISLEPIFGPVSFHLDLMKLIEHGYLSDTRTTTAGLDDSIDDDKLGGNKSV